MFDLPIQPTELDLAVCTKPVLKVYQGFDEFPIGSASSMASETLPVRFASRAGDIVGQAGSGGVEPTNALHGRFPSFFNIFRRAISLSARARA